MQKSYLVQNITSIRAVLIVRCSLYVCSVCVPPDFVVQINNFFSLVLFSTTIHEWRGKKLISKTIEYKLDSSSKMYWCNLNLKKFRKVFLENYRFCRKSRNDAKNREQGIMFFAIIMTQYIQKSIYNSPLTIPSI